MCDCMLFLKFMYLSVGNLYKSCDWRRRDVVSTIVFFGNCDKELYFKYKNVFLIFLCGNMYGNIIFFGKYVGIFFIECTAMSMRSSSKASSSSRVNKFLFLIFVNGWFKILFLVVLMM